MCEQIGDEVMGKILIRKGILTCNCEGISMPYESFQKLPRQERLLFQHEIKTCVTCARDEAIVQHYKQELRRRMKVRANDNSPG